MDRKTTSRKPDKFIVRIPSASKERFLPFQHENLAPMNNAGILGGGISSLTPGYEISRPQSKEHLIFYTLSGKAEIFMRDRMMEIGPDGIFVIPAGLPHRYWLDSGKWNLFWLTAKDSSRWSFLKGIDAVKYSSTFKDLLHGAIEGLLRVTDMNSRKMVREGWLYSSLIVELLEKDLRKTGDEDERLSVLWAKINSDISARWTLKRMSSIAGLSRNYFIRYCREKTGVPPLQFLKRIRMQAAENLLLNTDYKMEVIASQTGFSNQYSFSSAFKKYHKVSPKYFREMKKRAS